MRQLSATFLPRHTHLQICVTCTRVLMITEPCLNIILALFSYTADGNYISLGVLRVTSAVLTAAATVMKG